jgi:hypothetical protein
LNPSPCPEAVPFKGRVWMGMGFVQVATETNPIPAFPLKGKETSRAIPLKGTSRPYS